jgi:hypothetical protein
MTASLTREYGGRLLSEQVAPSEVSYDECVLLRIGALAFAALLAACAPHVPEPPENVTVGTARLPAPPTEPNDAPPQILAAEFSALDVRRGQHWSGAFVTGTNVASLEVRTNLFSINVPKRAPGRFTFTLDVLDTPPIFVRRYRLRVIARNSAGTAYEEDVPFDLR